jgi:hypothetical protein
MGNAHAVKNLLGMFAVWRYGRPQDGNRCAQMRRPVVKKFNHERVPLEHSLDDSPLHAYAASVNESDFGKSRRVRFVQVLFDHGGDVSRGEGVEVEGPVDGKPERVLILHCYGVVEDLSYRAVTSVLMPPRTEKSPTTVMRRGSQAATRSSRI